MEARSLDVRILVEVVDPLGVEGAGATDDSIDVVPFAEKQLRQITAVLAGDAGNQRSFVHKINSK